MIFVILGLGVLAVIPWTVKGVMAGIATWGIFWGVLSITLVIELLKGLK
jgi:hypothetical protein